MRPLRVPESGVAIRCGGEQQRCRSGLFVVTAVASASASSAQAELAEVIPTSIRKGFGVQTRWLRKVQTNDGCLGSLERLGLTEGVPPLGQPLFEEVLPIRDVLERIRRSVAEVLRFEVKSFRNEFMIQLGQMNGVPKYTGVRNDHQATGPTELLLELALPVFSATGEEYVSS